MVASVYPNAPRHGTRARRGLLRHSNPAVSTTKVSRHNSASLYPTENAPDPHSRCTKVLMGLNDPTESASHRSMQMTFMVAAVRGFEASSVHLLDSTGLWLSRTPRLQCATKKRTLESRENNPINIMNGASWNQESLWYFATSHGLNRRAFLGLLAAGGAAAVFADCGVDPAIPDAHSGSTDPGTPPRRPAPVSRTRNRSLCVTARAWTRVWKISTD